MLTSVHMSMEQGFRRKIERFARKVTNTDIDTKIKNEILSADQNYFTNQEKVLANNPLEGRKNFIGRIKEGTVLVKIKDGGFAIFKPYEGHEVPRRKEQIQNERAAYAINQFLGLNLVPPTVVRTLPDTSGIGDQIGSIQEFIADAKTGQELTDEEKQQLNEENITALAFFDLVTLNNDRNYGNYLVKGQQLYAIDHGNCFILPKNTTSAKDAILSDLEYDLKGPHMMSSKQFWERKMPAEVVSNLKNFLDSEKDQQNLEGELSKLIGDEEAGFYIRRILSAIEAINDDGKLNQGTFQQTLRKHLLGQYSSTTDNAL